MKVMFSGALVLALTAVCLPARAVDLAMAQTAAESVAEIKDAADLCGIYTVDQAELERYARSSVGVPLASMADYVTPKTRENIRESRAWFRSHLREGCQFAGRWMAPPWPILKLRGSSGNAVSGTASPSSVR